MIECQWVVLLKCVIANQYNDQSELIFLNLLQLRKFGLIICVKSHDQGHRQDVNSYFFLFCLFLSSLIFLRFSKERFYTCLLGCIPKHLVVFDDFSISSLLIFFFFFFINDLNFICSTLQLPRSSWYFSPIFHSLLMYYIKLIDFQMLNHPYIS